MSNGKSITVRDYQPGEIIVLPAGATRIDAIRALSKTIPQNEYKLPTIFYRSDRLPNVEAGEILTQDDADLAVVPLSYDEGYPTFNDGKIFWFQLPHEPYDSFLLFQKYIDQVETEGLRQLQLLGQSHGIALQKLTALSYEYYWQDRARSFDLFQIAADRKRRASRARRLEDTHFTKASDLLQVLLRKFDDPEWIEGLSSKDAIEILLQLAKLQRISVGLSINGNAGAETIDPLAASTGADLMKEITRHVNRDEALGLGNSLQQLMTDPKFAANAQDLILRVRHQDQANAGAGGSGSGGTNGQPSLGQQVIDADFTTLEVPTGADTGAASHQKEPRKSKDLHENQNQNQNQNQGQHQDRNPDPANGGSNG